MTGLNWEQPTDLHLAYAAELVYRPWNVVEDTCTAWGADDYEHWDREGTQAFLATFGRVCLVSWAGTAEVVDVWHDLDCTLERFHQGWGRVHRGFLAATSYVTNAIYDAIGQRNRKRTGGPLKLFFTGHSLGAACATLFAATIAEYKQGPVWLTTFGGPRVGNAAFADRFNGESSIQHHRYQNNNDAVTLVPGWIHGYRHTGRLQYINGGKVITSPKLWERVKWGIAGAVDHIGVWGLDCIEDHRIGRYVKALERA